MSIFRPVTGARSTIASLVFLAGVAALPGHARSADAAKPLGRLALSQQLAEWGRADKNPLALVVAADIRSRVGTKAVERVPEQSGEAGGAAEAGTDTTVAGLLAEAVALAPKDPTIAGLAEDVKASAAKGLVDGAGVSRATVRAAGTDWYRKLRFEGSRYAEAYLELSGSGRLDVSIWDAAGNLVCRDPNPSSVAYCGWTPSATASFDVKVENRSTVPVAYRMYTN